MQLSWGTVFVLPRPICQFTLMAMGGGGGPRLADYQYYYTLGFEYN